MAKDESRRNRCVEVSKKLRNGFQMVAVSCYMMVLFAQPAAAADTMWTRFSTGCLWRVSGHLHHRGCDGGCGSPAGTDDLPQ